MLKFIVSPIVGILAALLTLMIGAWTGIGIIPADPNWDLSEPRITRFLVLASIIVGIISMRFTYSLYPKRTVSESLANSVSFVKNKADEISSMVSEDDSDYFAIAKQEVIDGEVIRGCGRKP